MAEQRNQITDLTAVTNSDLADDDRFILRDRSDTTDGAEGTDKQGDLNDLKNVTGRRVDDVTALRGLVGTADSQVNLLGYTTPGDGGGGTLYWDASSTTDDNGYKAFKPDSLAAADPGRWILTQGTFHQDITVNIPSHYATLQAAIDDLSRFRVKQGVTIDLMIESGHQPTSGIAVSSGDYSHFQISSIDASITASSDFVIIVDNGRAPVLNTVIDLVNSTEFNSYNLTNGAIGYVKPGAGMRNGNRGMHISNASICSADGCIFTGFQQAGLHASRNSHVQSANADFSGNSLSAATFGAVYASRGSIIHGPNMNATSSGSYGVRAQRFAQIVCPDVDVSGASNTAIIAVLGGKIFSASGALTANNLQGQAVVAQNGAVVVIPGAVFNNTNLTSADAVEVRDSSLVEGISSISGYTGNVILALEGGRASLRGITIDSGANGFNVLQGGRIDAKQCTITNMTSNGAVGIEGGYINVVGGSITGSGSNDLAISDGSWISANGCSTTNGVGSPALADTNLTGGFNFADNGARGFIWT